ncbi:RraA family protein [Cohnella cellulosilytica]|uniref:Putative 4-hydroxy-4-methyl-2-oxoglutarate aldolase n=1 Tax=Cohnella cellulosilytica TaxID=986710 RepID=A0ABW2F6Q4_9BACL
MPQQGFRVYTERAMPSAELVGRFRKVVTPHISDNMSRLHAIAAGLRPFHREGRLLGAALTVKTRPGDNLLVHKAIDMALPGDVIVVDAGGDVTNSIVGEIMLRLAESKGIAGFIIDGAIRDTAAFSAGDFPVYARGVTHRGPYKDGPGEINVPISVGGMLVKPGDIIVGDEDGLAVVPLEEAEALLQSIEAQQIREEKMLREAASGEADRSWVDETLRLKGCEVIDGKYDFSR